MFKDRFAAGEQLAKKLLEFKDTAAVVIAIPRGGVQVGYAVARALRLRLDVLFTKKIPHPMDTEVALGAVSTSGRVVAKNISVPHDYIEQQTRRLRGLLHTQEQQYASRHSSLVEKTVLLVDDGAATGNTLLAAIALLREQQPSQVIVAVPVASTEACNELRRAADKLVVLRESSNFRAVGAYYDTFEQISHEEAIRLLHKTQEVAS